MSFFFLLYLGGIGSSFLPGHPGKVVVAGILLAIYAAYVYRTLTGSGESANEEELTPLRLHGLLGGQGSPHTLMAWAQVLAALGLMIGGAYLFVSEIDRISEVSTSAAAGALAGHRSRWRPSFRRHSTASSGYVKAKTHWPWATSAAPWSSRVPSPSQ